MMQQAQKSSLVLTAKKNVPFLAMLLAITHPRTTFCHDWLSLLHLHQPEKGDCGR